MTTIVAIVAGVILAAATVTGVVTSVTDSAHHATQTPVSNVTLYGSR